MSISTLKKKMFSNFFLVLLKKKNLKITNKPYSFHIKYVCNMARVSNQNQYLNQDDSPVEQ